jgi:hypothetical protein
MRLISKAEFARERGVHPSRVSQWLRDGRVVATAEGKIDADVAHEKLGGQLDQAKGIRRDGNVTSTGPAAGAASGKDLVDQAGDRKPDGGRPRDEEESGYWEHKTRSAKADAQLKEMQVMERAGVLTSAAGVAAEARESMRAVRNALLAIPDRLAPVLDPASPSRAHKLLTDELQKVIRELSDRLAQRAAEAPAAREPDAALV